MESIRDYLLRVIAAAMICTIGSALCGKKGTIANICKLISGVYLTLVLAYPLVHFKLPQSNHKLEAISQEAENITANAQLDAKQQIAAVMKSEAEAYILDKAEQLGAQIQVSIQLDNSEYPIPVSSQVTGNLSPYAKKMLSDILTKDLGIAQEEQVWS